MKQYKYSINGNAYDVTIQSVKGSHASVEVNGIPMEVEMLTSTLTEDQLPDTVAVAAPTTAPAPQPQPSSTPEAPAAATGAGEGKPVVAPLPGIISKILVTVGQAVKKGETVVVLEAMKMENNITAEMDGTITGIAVKAGDSVMEGTVLVTIQ